MKRLLLSPTAEDIDEMEETAAEMANTMNYRACKEMGVQEPLLTEWAEGVMVTHLKASVCSAWSRPQSSEDDRQIFLHRDRITGRKDVGHLGFATDLSFPKHIRGRKACTDPGERALLIQTLQHYSELRSQFSELAENFDGQRPGFGENLIMDGFSSDSVCVGDVLQSDRSSLRLQVTMPRLACYRPDRRHPVEEKQTGEPGTVRRWLNTTGRGGFFCKVLVHGDIGDGDVLQLTSRTYPKWNLGYLSSLCYTDSPLALNWTGSREELDELCGMMELGEYEWKERLLYELEVITSNEVRARSISGDGTLTNVGIKLDGSFQCAECAQRFVEEKALAIHFKFVHDPNRLQATRGCAAFDTVESVKFND